MSKKIEYTKGQKIRECVFLEDTCDIKGCRTALFKCRCGNTFKARVYLVKIGDTASCGCIYKSSRKLINLIHGHSVGGIKRRNETPEYRSWLSMKQRCNNPSNWAYKDYGGRGIRIDNSWNDFTIFFNDMGYRPSLEHSLERRDNNKGYSKDNCYWATKKQQANNKRNSSLITYNGRTQTLKMWCEELGLKYKQTWKRIYSFNWTVEDSFNIPCTKVVRLLTYNGKTQGLTEWAKELGISVHVIRGRLDSLGLSVEEALNAKSRMGNNQFSKSKSA